MRLPSQGIVAVAACGLLLAQSACTPQAGPGTAPSAAAATAAAGQPSSGPSPEPADADAFPKRDHKISISTTTDGGGKVAPLAVNKDGRLIWDGAGAGPETLFVLQPAGDRHQIQVLEADGDRSCLGLSDKRKNGSSYIEARVVAATCDASRDGQRWTLIKSDFGYYIHSGKLYLSSLGDVGVVAQEQGEGLPSPGMFTFTDKGSAS
jgi:hypothetical protein